MAYDAGLFDVTVIGDRAILENLDQMPETVREILRSKVAYFAEEIRDQVIENIDERLSKTAGTKEKQYSGAAGHLRDAVELQFDDDGLEAVVYIDESIPYARIQEQGGVIPPHLILPRNGKLLAFQAAFNDKTTIVSRVFHPGGAIPATHYMRDAYRMLSPQIGKAVQKAVVDGIRQQMRNG